MTSEEYIRRANIVHSNRFDYSKTIHVRSSEKVIITCPIHGDFEQNSHSHLRGVGCKKCSALSRNDARRITIYNLSERCNEKHHGKYDYSLATFTNSSDKIKIICPIHGVFEQTIVSHMAGRRCPKCAVISGSNKLRKDPNVLLSQFIDVHDGFYKYPNISFNNVGDKIIIQCPIHGYFDQAISSHLSGRGCPKCSLEYNNYRKESWIKRSKNRIGTFYIIRCYNDTESFYKFGVTFTGVTKRYIGKKSMPYNYEIVRLVMSTDKDYIWELERRFLKIKRNDRYNPKILFGGSAVECFSTFTESNRH